MRIEEERKKFNLSQKKLRRARKLYVHICLKDIEKYGNPIIDKMAENAQKSGLYSHKTDIKSIRQSIFTYYFKLTKERESIRRDAFAWHQWCRKMDVSALSGYFNHKKKIVIPAVIH